MSFNDIKDQDIPLRLMRNILRQNRVPNGLLFWGPEGVGKRFAAIELAKAINCTSGTFDACDTCLSCRKVMSGNHSDVKIVAPSGKVRIINVEAIDTISELTAYRPFEGQWRVILIQDADRMRADAQNHFLKTLEEPASKTTFVLQTAYPSVLLPTISLPLPAGALRHTQARDRGGDPDAGARSQRGNGPGRGLRGPGTGLPRAGSRHDQ